MLSAKLVMRFMHDFEFMPKLLSEPEVARLANWAGIDVYGGQLDYDHFCLLLARASAIALSLPPPNPQYTTNVTCLERFLCMIDMAEQSELLHMAVSKRHTKNFARRHMDAPPPPPPQSPEVLEESPPPIPEIEVDWHPIMNAKSRPPPFDAAVAASVLEEWAKHEGLHADLVHLHKHYSVLRDGVPCLQVNQFVKLLQDASALPPTPAASEADIVGIYCEFTDPGGLIFQKFLCCLAMVLVKVHQLVTQAEVFSASQKVLRERMVPYARLLQKEVQPAYYRGGSVAEALPQVMRNDNKVGNMLLRAQTKFSELDVDCSGYLEGDEIVELSMWVWSSFRPGGKPITELQKRNEAEKLRNRHAANSDGRMSFAEFAEYFEKTGTKIEQFRRQQQRRSAN